MLRLVYSFLVLAIKNDKQQLMKVFSIFTVEYQPEGFEKHAEKFMFVHLRLFFRWR